MTVESTREDLIAIEQAHQEDHDGGYRLASALCNYRSQMPESSAREWDRVLLGWVRDESAHLWGIALEALARAGGSGVTEELANMLRLTGKENEWREYVCHTLIRRGYYNKELILEVEQSARHSSPMGLPNLAGLLVLVPELLSTAVACVVTAISSGNYEYIESNVPPFVYAAADSNPELLIQLVQQITAENSNAGRLIGEMIAEYLEKPFVRRRFSKGVADVMAERIRMLR